MPVKLFNYGSGLDEFAKAIPAAIDAYEHAQDRKMKQMELAAQLTVSQERRAREFAHDQLSRVSFESSVKGNQNLTPSQKTDMLNRGLGSPEEMQPQQPQQSFNVADNGSPAGYLPQKGIVAQQQGMLGQQNDPWGVRNPQKEEEQSVELQQKKANLRKTLNQVQQEKLEALPLDSKKMVESLATKNADKIGIKNQIEAVLNNWDNLPDDQKVFAGQQLIKTLNSAEGKDAVGVDERRVLAGKLEFAKGNFTNSNPTQFGRDLIGFKTQAENVAKSMGTAIKSNQGVIDKHLGRKSFATEEPPADEGMKKPWEKYK